MLPNVEYIKTLVNGLKEFVNSKIKLVRKDIDSLPQADWNQNDPTAKDYVKGRTHWTEHKEIWEELTYDNYAKAGLLRTSDVILTFKIDGIEYRDIVGVWKFSTMTFSAGNNTISLNYQEPSGFSKYSNVLFLHKFDEVHQIDEKFISIKNSNIVNGRASGSVHGSNINPTVDSGLTAEDFGDYSFSFGVGSVASDTGASAFGYYNQANGEYSHAEGKETKAEQIASHAEGWETVSSGLDSHSEGFRTTASDAASHAEGFETVASDVYSHAEGRNTVASGSFSHAQGYQSKASGSGAHAEGYATDASGEYSHAEGYGTVASGDHSHVSGSYNIKDINNEYVYIIGNGTSIVSGDRSNAYTLDWDGNAWFAGDVYVGSTSGTNKDDGSKKLATEAYVDERACVLTSSTPGSTKKFKITVDDSGTITTMEV